MKRNALLYLLLGIFLLGISCKKEKSVETGGFPGGGSGWQFSEGGVDYKGTMDSAQLMNQGGQQVLVLQGASADGTGLFSLVITSSGSIGTGTYTNPEAFLQYLLNGSAYYETDAINADNFSVTITSINGNMVTGTFTGTVLDASGQPVTIVNGKFTAYIAGGGTLPGNTGQLTLWSRESCGGTGGAIEVTVAGQQGSITSFQTTAPACGAAGMANFTLPEGDYTWKAYCGTDSAEGAVTVMAGACQTVEVVFASSPSATCRISNMAYYDLTGAVPIGALTSFFDANEQVNKIRLYDSVGNTLLHEFNLALNGTRLDIDADQYFILETGLRVKEFHGYIDPTDNSSARVIFTYEYDADGFMSKAYVAPEAAPTQIGIEITYLWTNENLTSVLVKYAGTGERTEFVYEYDTNTTVRSFLCFFPNNEINLFQSAIVYGRNSKNPVIKSTITDYDSTNTAISTSVSTFSNYVIDANNYVKSFSITGDGSVYDSDVMYKLSYKCH